MGALTKQQLADVQRQCDVWCYPTEFEEVSCITAMEAMAAGLSIAASNHGAIPETVGSSSRFLIPLKEGKADEDQFVKMLKTWEDYWKPDSSFNFTWSGVASQVQSIINDKFKAGSDNVIACARELMRNSDVYALQSLLTSTRVIDLKDTLISQQIRYELIECYKFAFENDWAGHYERYYNYERDRGVTFGPENPTGSNRFKAVAQSIMKLEAGSLVLDYGCAHGHYTNTLAQLFPEIVFVGVDLAESNIETARKWAEDEKIGNVQFFVGNHTTLGEIGEQYNAQCGFNGYVFRCDLIIAAEVLEHLESPQEVVDTLCGQLVDGGKMVITTPYGPWEAQGYQEHHPWRAHVHHFERQDLHDIWGHFPEFNIMAAPSGMSPLGEVVGSYITTFNWGTKGHVTIKGGEIDTNKKKSNPIDYKRKFATMNPRQTVSLCMITKDSQDSLRRALDSCVGVVDEIIIGIDTKTTDRTRQVITEFMEDTPLWPAVRIIEIDSPLEIGFDESRNGVIKEASGDWILWFDSDETIEHASNLFKYLRPNQYNGYAIDHHHISIEPLGVLKTDKPVRLFRNRKGIKFFGVVHEHPEQEMNKGVGHATWIPDVCIPHYGYKTEAVRRGRFSRNIDLMVRDREKYPERVIGHFLWVRDLALMCQFEIEQNGGIISPAMKERAEEGIKTWEKMIDDDEFNPRMVSDALEYYSTLTKIVGGGFEFSINFSVSKFVGGLNPNGTPLVAHFLTKDHMDKFILKMIHSEIKHYDSKYF